MAKKPLEHHEALLDATESVVAQRGAASLTLDAVATAAGVSKGGLLHHFPTKECLIDAVIDRTVGRWRQSLEEAIEAERPGPGRTARALVNLCLADVSTCARPCRNSSAAMLAVLMQQGERRTRLHQFYEELTRAVRGEELSSGLGDVVLACVDGLWLHWTTGLVPTDAADIDRLRKCLHQMLTQCRSEADNGLEVSEVGLPVETPS